MDRSAPFFQLPGDSLAPASAIWVQADDGVRLRIAHWGCEGATARGAVLLFPGRTEYIEKFAPIARQLNNSGYEVLAIDWRGQGLSDRLLDNPRTGHVAEFSDYQRDVIEMLVAATEMDLPKPWHLLAHSMGGGIGLAALLNDLPVSSAVFSAPMWGIETHGIPKPVALTIAYAANRLGMGGRAVPLSGGDGSYYLDTGFTQNLLTGNLDQWIRLLRETGEWPDLTIGGPSYDWLATALRECSRLAKLPSPDLPMTVAVGSEEKIVSVKAIRDRVARWHDARLLEYENCRHEVMMESPDLRERFLTAAIRQFDAAAS